MSAVLGPIHTWLYGKVLFQNGLATYIEQFAGDKNWMTEAADPGKLGELEQGALADICDTMNIHGWLQERVSLVERKLALLVTELTKDAPERITEIAEAAYEYGKANGLQENAGIAETYKFLDSKMLNGMPCERINVVAEQDDEHLIWEQVEDIHRPYWDEFGGNIEMYYMIREKLLEGLAETAGHHVIARGKVYELR